MATKIKVKGDPKKGELSEEMYISKGRTPLDTTADLRDVISGLAGGGYTSLSDENARASYSRLRALLGDTKANKLMTHIFIQNQRPEVSKLPIEGRVKSFYDMPVADEEVGNTLKKVKSFGYGVLPGFRESHSQFNQQLAGVIPSGVVSARPDTEKIKLRVAPKVQ